VADDIVDLIMKIVLLGPPGAGKGTLAKMLKDALGLVHISTGDILREEMKADSHLGREAKQYIESGGLVPDELVTKIVENKFATDSSLKDGYMLDGFPRTVPQAQDLDKILAKTQVGFDYALYMESTLPVIIRRLTGRRVCRSCGAVYHMVNRPSKKEGVCDSCGGELYQRADDNEETIRKRMDVYLENTLPIAQFYEAKNRLRKVNGDDETEAIRDALLNEDKK